MNNPTLDDRPFLQVDAATASANVKTYLAFIHNLTTYVTDKQAYEGVVHPDAVFYDNPNLINKVGQVRNSGKSLEGVAMGQKILATQRYDFIEIVETGNKLVIECTWRGVMAIDAGHLKQGQELKAYICMIVEFKDGMIYTQRNYDCYVPF